MKLKVVLLSMRIVLRMHMHMHMRMRMRMRMTCQGFRYEDPKFEWK